MKKLYSVTLIVLFMASMILLTDHIFPECRELVAKPAPTAVASRNGYYHKMMELGLGDVRALDMKQMGAIYGTVVFSPDNQLLAVGTENGEIILFSLEGRRLWSKQIGLGKINVVVFAQDGKRLLIGETSPRGALSCLETATGKEVWHIDSYPELGVDIQQKLYPGIVSIVYDQSGSIYAVGQRYMFDAGGNREYMARIYKINPTGEVIRRFPDNHNIDTWVGAVSVEGSGERFLFGTAAYYPGKSLQYNAQVYCMAESRQEPLWNLTFQPVPPYQTVAVRNAPFIAANGQAIATIAGDGRVFLHDREGRQLWQRSISQPRKIAGVYLNPTGIYAQIVGERVLFTTSNTYNRANWQLPTPLEHPSSNALFVFDLAGNLITHYNAGGMIGNIAVTDKQAAISVGMNVRTKAVAVHGITLLNLEFGTVLDSMMTTGPCINVAVSQDGNYVAGIEAPVKLDAGEIIGKYRLHIWKSNQNGE